MAYYELVNLCSGNRIGEFDTEGEALLDVRDVQRRRGPADIAAIALAYSDDQGNVTIIAEGEALGLLADRVSAASAVVA